MRKLGCYLFRLAAVGWLAQSWSAWACAVCFGRSDSDLAKGMNIGIFVLLAVVVAVLGSIASFFIYLARRAARTRPEPSSDYTPEPTGTTQHV